MKNISELKKAIEEEFNVQFSSFPGKLQKNNFYVPQKIKSNTTRFYIIFKYDKGKSFAYFGDFYTQRKIKYLLKFDISGYKTTKNIPSDKNFKLKLEKFHTKSKKFLSTCSKGINSYIPEEFDCSFHIYKGFICIPFTNIKTNNIQALQFISKDKKIFSKNSFLLNSGYFISKPKNNDELLYVTEGLKTGLCVNYITKKAVFVTGGLSNLISTLPELCKIYNNIVLCVEKPLNTYIELKNKYNCYMVGDGEYDDIYDYYIKTNKQLTKALLNKFYTENYIPLGLNDKNKIVLYLRKTKQIQEYSKTEHDLLYSDVLDLSNLPDIKKSKEFYYKIREICRKKGRVTNIEKFYVGIYPLGDDFIYYDQQNCFLLKDRELIKIKQEDLIAKNLFLCSKENHKSYNISKLDILNSDELNYIKETLNLLSFKNDKTSKKLILGWIIQSLLCGGVPFRAPLWLTAKSFSGKSQVSRRFIFNCFPFYERTIGRATTAKWLPRKFHGKALPLHRDEFEPSLFKAEDAKDEFEFMRATATERFPKRGISGAINETTIEFVYCMSILYSGIKIPRDLSVQDIGRIIFIDLLYVFKKNYEKDMKKFESFMTLKNRLRFFKTAFLKLPDINKTYFDLMKSSKYIKIKSHKKSCIFMLASCYNHIFNEQITNKEIDELLVCSVNEKETHSKILIDWLNLYIDKNLFFNVGKLTNFKALTDKDFNSVFEENGIYIRTNKKGTHYLYLRKMKAFKYISNNFYFNNRSQVDVHYIKNLLESDGSLLVNNNLNVGKLQKQVIPRGNYIVFDFLKIIKQFE